MPKVSNDKEQGTGQKEKDLDVQDEFQKIRDRYKEQSRKRGFNALVYGDFGTGKTYSLHTAPKPVLVHSFDPGGSRTLRKWIDKGTVMVDDRFEREEPGDPKAYREWEEEFARLREINFFEHVGTYVIDSLTTMSEALMNAVMKGNKKQKSRNREVETYIPQLNDYQVQQYTIRDFLNICCGLPCNFICTGHIDRSKDEVSGKMISTPMITGKLAQKIPMLFDEVYVTQTKQTSEGTEYYFLTESDGLYQARSRLAASGKIKKKEKPSFKYILDQVDFDYEEKDLHLNQPHE